MHGEGKEELLHNGFPPLWGHRQDALHLMCSFSDLLCVVFPVNSTHSSYFLENPPLFSDRQCKLCTGSWEGNHIFFMIMCMLLLYLSCPLTRRLLSFTLVFNSPLHVLVSAYFCQLHVSFFVFLCLPVHAGLSPPPPPPPATLVGGALAYSSTLPACLKNKPPHRQEGGSTMPRSILTHRVLRFTDEVTVR